MLIAHLIGGVIIFTSLLLRMPQASSTLSLFLTAFKSVAPVSFLQQIEDVFSFSPALVDPPSFYSDIVFSPHPGVTDMVVCYSSIQHTNLSCVAGQSVSGEETVRKAGQEQRILPLNRDMEKPASTPVAYFNIFLFLASPCAILTLYLAYVSHHGLRPQAQL